MSRKEKSKFIIFITMQEAAEVLCGKIIYSFHTFEDETGKTLGKSIIFYKSDIPEEEADHLSLLLFDDGKIALECRL